MECQTEATNVLCNESGHHAENTYLQIQSGLLTLSEVLVLQCYPDTNQIYLVAKLVVAATKPTDEFHDEADETEHSLHDYPLLSCTVS